MNSPNMSGNTSSSEPLLGRLLVQTRAVAAWVSDVPTKEDVRGSFIADCIRIHASKRWDLTSLDDHDTEVNEQALSTGARVLTSHEYLEDGDTEPVKIWVLTEAEGEDGIRASTCVLFPDDY